jgi:hypothetical protein
MTLYRGGWPYANPPNTQFTLNTESPQAKGLVGWWATLGNAGDSTLRDFSGKGLHGTINANVSMKIHPVLGRVFTGANNSHSGVDVTNFPAGSYSSISIGFWFEKDASATHQLMVEQGGDTLWIRQAGTGPVAVYLGDTTSPGYHNADTGVGVVGTLYHYMMTYDGSTLRHYLNGIADGTGNTTGAMSFDSSLCLGARESSTTDSLEGSLGDIRIYDRVLPASEIWTIYAPDTRWDLYQPVIPWALPISLAEPTPPDDKLPDKIRIARTYQIPIHQLQL